ncbi:hypothetical protein NLG97_g2097 [Lecanicillium saksenae]|uniref:Uncharacterized protein n=1 Tax=Lecanicillium saksenae TaxID=468837 RepID=A0ACC1R5B2_9HYPO|nr:hypothetical protein NLG97_g2097 [Lecanicillium saksenae]
MRLKRGIERESCDFCHRRKIKCDKVARAATGIDCCTACERRDIACVVDDSTDIRLQKRRLNASRGFQSASITESTPFTTLPGPPPPPPSRSLTVIHDPAVSTEVAPGVEEGLFDLNAESSFFLDQIFMGNLAADWTNDTYAGLAMDVFAPSTSPVRPQTVPNIDHYQDLWHDCELPFDTFITSIHNHFDYAALPLPITFEDAFWSDVEDNTASAALVCAVACRGMPFTQEQDKWIFQKRLAIKFKQLFLRRQQDAPGKTPLDDIEALALMINFPHDQDTVSGLERLFLSKETLVLMTLQLGPATEECQLSRASERHTLLFWHVYGLDAFTCLDSKTISRIPETQSSPPMQYTGAGYLDAVLSLALVARAILQKLSGSARHGIRYHDIDSLYKQLEDWRSVSCPTHLRHWGNYEELLPEPCVNLQRAVLHMLRINCYMQIESWAEEHGVCIETLADHMASARIEYESLRALDEGAKIAKWLGDCRIGEFAVIDLAPNILRDINAGLGVWICLRGSRNSLKSTYRLRQGAEKDTAEIDIEAATMFRANVALAKSHSDTPTVLSRVDEHMDGLKRITASLSE